jgi:5-keto 4-deoxyuronate isomerase
LNDSGGGLSAAQVGSIVKNDSESTYSYVTVVDSDTQLTLANDIFDTGDENYIINTNMYGSVTFDGSTYLLDSSDTVAIDKGTDLSADPYLPISDDILGTIRS